MTLNEVLVELMEFRLAFRVYPALTLLILRVANVASPDEVETVRVPLRVLPEIELPKLRDTSELVPLTMFPKVSKTVTTTLGFMDVPATTLLGGLVKLN